MTAHINSNTRDAVNNENIGEIGGFGGGGFVAEKMNVAFSINSNFDRFYEIYAVKQNGTMDNKSGKGQWPALVMAEKERRACVVKRHGFE